MKDISNKQVHKWLWIIIITAGILSIIHLGSRPFWGDEIHLINIAEGITEYGLPIIDNQTRNIEVTYELDDLNLNTKIYNERVNYGIPVSDERQDLVIYTLHPWLTSYIIAIPIKIMKLSGTYKYDIRIVEGTGYVPSKEEIKQDNIRKWLTDYNEM